MITVTSSINMVNIDHKEFSYANIKNMYTTGDGVGIQTNFSDEKNKLLLEQCNIIADNIYKLKELIENDI